MVFSFFSGGLLGLVFFDAFSLLCIFVPSIYIYISRAAKNVRNIRSSKPKRLDKHTLKWWLSHQI